METAGFIERREDPADRRAKTLHLTEEGRQACAHIEAALIELRTQLYAGIPDEDIGATLRVFATLRSAWACRRPTCRHRCSPALERLHQPGALHRESVAPFAAPTTEPHPTKGENDMRDTHSPPHAAGLGWALVLFGVIVLLCGAALALGGATLISLGGSWYYLPAGVGLVLAGGQYARRRPSGLAWLALVFVATVIWALAEVSLDFWQLLPRLVLLAVLLMFGLLLAPRIGFGSRGAYSAAGVLFVALLATLGAAFVPHGVIRPSGAASSAPVAAAAAAVAGEGAKGAVDDWTYYGRTPHGTRYAPVDQINTGNVKQLEVATPRA